MDKKKMIGDIVTSITDKELKKDYFFHEKFLFLEKIQ